MIKPGRVATHGRLTRTATKAVLVAAVAGYLSFGDTPIRRGDADGFTRHEIAQANNIAARRKRIVADDEEVFLIIQTFMKIQ